MVELVGGGSVINRVYPVKFTKKLVVKKKRATSLDCYLKPFPSSAASPIFPAHLLANLCSPLQALLEAVQPQVLVLLDSSQETLGGRVVVRKTLHIFVLSSDGTSSGTQMDTTS